MLNKRVCMQCVSMRKGGQVHEPLGGTFWREWDAHDEDNWERLRIVVCRFYHGIPIDVRLGPPGWCPMSLEHVMESQCANTSS